MKQDVAGRLRATLHHARFLDLGIQDDPQAVQSLWGYYNPEKEEHYESVLDAFLQCQGRLLLLGDPGAGKTTALLHIASEIVRLAEHDADNPLPVIVNLSKLRLPSQAGARQGFFPLASRAATESDAAKASRSVEDWLVAEIANFPGFDRTTVREWLRDGRFALLLDGLDEFNDERRGELAEMLNTTLLRDHPDVPIVICSRINEYAVLKSDPRTRLALKGAVTLQSLSEEQVADYLRAARTPDLQAAIKQDPALRELSRTPLTLCMLVLAYGGDAPAPQVADLSLSETRLRLFDSYVARMLQRQARRDHDVAFDDVRANDVPVSRYRYPPDAVNRWLGWLALTLSVRMRTTVAPDGIVRLLMIAKKPQRQFLNFWVAHAAVAIPVALCLAISGAFLAPPMPAGWWTAGAMVGFAWLVLPVAAAGERDWGPGIPLLWSIAFGTALLGVVLVTLVIAAALPSGVSPLLILPACIAAMIALLFYESRSAIEREMAHWTLGAAVVAVLVALAYREWFEGASVTMAGFDIPALAGAVALGWVPIIICLTAFETSADSLVERAATAGLLSGLAALVTILAAWMGSIHWIGVMTFLASVAICLCSFDDPDARQSVPTVMAMSAAVAIGSIAAGPLGAAAASLPVLVLSLTARRLTAWRAVEDYVATQIESVLLSRCAWRMLAIFRCFPMKRRPFFRSAADAFLLKVSGQEYEFVHRLLRDHFALRQLLPKLRSGEAERLETILALGYQGDSALDLLVDFVRNGQPKARAAAISALRHIPSPTATECFRAAIFDRDPDVRFALVGAILDLPAEECIKLFEEMRPLGDGTEMKAFVSLPSKHDRYLSMNLILYEGTWRARLIRSQLDLVGLETLLHYLQHGKLLERCSAASFLRHIHEPRVVDALLDQIRDREPRIRIAVATALGGHRGDQVRAALETLQFDRNKDVRTAAGKALQYVNAETADPEETFLGELRVR